MGRDPAARVLGTSERTARSILSKLVEDGFLKSRTPKSPVRVVFPLYYRDRLFPSLFADHTIEALEPPPSGGGRRRLGTRCGLAVRSRVPERRADRGCRSPPASGVRATPMG